MTKRSEKTLGNEVLATRLEALLGGLVGRKGFKEVVLAVEKGDRSWRWSGARSEANGVVTPRDSETPFFVASIDKLFNATLAMQLVEQGRLGLEVPIVAYLAPDLMRGLHRLEGNDYSERITVRHLLGHTSGLADWLEDSPPGGRSLVERVLREGDREISLPEVLSLVREQLRPHFPPAEGATPRPRVRYSDTNYLLLSAVIEAATGQPLHEAGAEQLLRPLGLRHTFFAGRSQPMEPTPEPFGLSCEGRPLAIPRLMRSFWGLYSTTGDMLALLRGLVRGEVFREPATLDVMQRRWNRFGFPLDRAALRAPGWPIEYGLGLMRFCLPRFMTPFHPLPPVVGHSGSTGCWLFYCREWDLFLSGSVNEVTAGAVPYRIVPKILALFRSTRGEPA